MQTAIEAVLPHELVEQAHEYIRQGWAIDFDALLADALRRYLESHAADLTAVLVREDVEWGLHGRD
jgi:hypothetical protein